MAKNTPGKPGDSRRAARLRQQAEEFLRTAPRDIEAMSAEAIQVLVHEFQVYQIELEMQNEELRRTQHELEESRSQYQDLFDFAPVGYLSLDHEGRIEQANLTAANLLGVEHVQLHGAPLARFVVSDDRDILHRHRQALKDTDSHVCELRIQHQHGDHQDVRLETRTVRDETRDTPVYRMVLLIITERKRMEEQLRASEQRLRELTQEQERLLITSDRLVSLGELAASLAHEFNNPLGIAMGFAQDLLSEAEPTDPAYRRLQIIESQTRRCGQLLRNLSDLARPPQTHRIPTDLAAIARQSLGLVSGRSHENKIETQLDVAANIDPLSVDPQQVEQVLLNVYFNAIEAMSDGGTLTVRVWKHPAAEEAAGGAGNGPKSALPDEHRGDEEQSEVRIAVIDTGGGITPDHRSKIFRPFFTTKKQRGMGLGLSICDSIMRAHRGHISIDTIPGQGSTVLLHFPMDVPIGELA